MEKDKDIMERDKDIVRSDEEIKQTIVKELTADKRIDPAKVEIEVNNGKVTLRGDVPDATAQSSANWIATAVPGVTDVINQFSVREPATLTMAGDKKKRDRSH
jgi:osmotically-inducible protein OsmY